MVEDELNRIHFINYDSIHDFIACGFGYCVKINQEIAAACTSVLVCSKGVEVSVITQPKYRQLGLATLVSARFLIHCLENNIYPNWDASNLKSVGLAKKLGMTYKTPYAVYVLEQ